MFFTPPQQALYVSRTDTTHPLASYSKHSFELDGETWPSVEHYYQAMKFEDSDVRDRIRQAHHPEVAGELAKKHKKAIRDDWKKIKQVVMTRGAYIKCRTHAEVAEALLASGDTAIVETSQFDYYWGCGRDGRGHNTYGKVLMGIRDKLREEMSPDHSSRE
jgi:ribA/ribD-fused uncharacterized protein